MKTSKGLSNITKQWFFIDLFAMRCLEKSFAMLIFICSENIILFIKN